MCTWACNTTYRAAGTRDWIPNVPKAVLDHRQSLLPSTGKDILLGINFL